MKILFSPAEGKNEGGIRSNTDIFGSYALREEVLSNYNKIIFGKNKEQIQKLFGLKNFHDCEPYLHDIFESPKMMAIMRYNGVAYQHLKYDSLSAQVQTYVQENTIIFSNLYGPILASDLIANYKVKQGNDIGSIDPEKFYKQNFSQLIDSYLQDDDILDLRAGYYEKFYKISKSFTTLKFLKNGKVVSHWAKAYRGIVLREVAENAISSIDTFHTLEINGLQVHSIKQQKNKTEITYEILD